MTRVIRAVFAATLLTVVVGCGQDIAKREESNPPTTLTTVVKSKDGTEGMMTVAP